MAVNTDKECIQGGVGGLQPPTPMDPMESPNDFQPLMKERKKKRRRKKKEKREERKKKGK